MMVTKLRQLLQIQQATHLYQGTAIVDAVGPNTDGVNSRLIQ